MDNTLNNSQPKMEKRMEDHYSSEEEEVYFGSFAKSEITRRKQIFGDHFTSTPEQIRHLPTAQAFSQRRKECLPDVLNGANSPSSVQEVPIGPNSSTPAQSQLSDDSVKNPTVLEDQRHEDSLLDESDDVIIINASDHSNSIITLSDDESFVRHENSSLNVSAKSKNDSDYVAKESASSSISRDVEKPEAVELSDESYSSSNGHSGAEKTNNEPSPNMSSNDVELNEKSHSTFNSSNHGDNGECIETNHRNTFVKGSDSAFVQDSYLHDSVANNFGDNGCVDVMNSFSCNESQKLHSSSGSNFDYTSLVDSENSSIQEIDDFVSGTSASPKKSISSAILDNSVTESKIISNNFETTNDTETIAEPDRTDSSPSERSFKLQNDVSLSQEQILDNEVTDAQGNKFGICGLSNSNDLETLKNTSTNAEDNRQDKSNLVMNDSLPSQESSKLDKDVSFRQEQLLDNEDKQGNKCDLSDLGNNEFSLNGVSDSILNISSLLSPFKVRQSSNPVHLKCTLYEDISCDGDQLNNETNSNERMAEDLHMSVDDVDFLQDCSDNLVDSRRLTDFTNISQPSEYMSCPQSGHSSFKTAHDQTCGGNQSVSGQSNSFQNYRDLSDLDIGDEDAVSIKSNQENTNEAGFEIIAQNRQNSFIRSPVTKTPKDKGEGEKSKQMTKLPVFQGTKSLLKTPKLYVKPDLLKASSFKFAEQISHTRTACSNIARPASARIPTSISVSKQITSPRGISKPASPASLSKKVNSPAIKETKPQTEIGKLNKTPIKTSSFKFNSPASKMNIPTPKPNIPTPKLNIPTPRPNISTPKLNIPTPRPNISTPKLNIPTPKPVSSLTKSKIPSQKYLSVSKTPAKNGDIKTSTKNIVHSTPAQNISAIPRSVKSETKVNRVWTPSKSVNSSIQSADKNSPLKDKYKNIVSPIHAYIKGSPSVPQRKAHTITEEHIFEKPMNKPVAPAKSPLAVMQKLKFEKASEQENINPNVIDLSRDTIPSKIFEHSQEVFWKHQPVESRLPKMGEKQTKILTGIPKVKITRHEGRVNECPKAKGVLVPNNSVATPPDVSGADLLPREQEDGRISVRIQKTVELQ